MQTSISFEDSSDAFVCFVVQNWVKIFATILESNFAPVRNGKECLCFVSLQSVGTQRFTGYTRVNGVQGYTVHTNGVNGA